MTTTNVREKWGADFFGAVNEMPLRMVEGLDQILVAMGTEPGFQGARRALLRDMGIGSASSVFEAGCGTGAALPQLVELMGPDGRITGIDPTVAFMELARQRAATAHATGARYETGDIRDIGLAADSFDAAFCDKVRIHAGPADVAVAEMKRVTRPGGRVGALEWMPYFVLGTTRPDLVARFNGMLRQAVYDYQVSTNLPALFHGAGLADVQCRAHLASATSLDNHPFWHAFLIDQLPMFVHVGLLDEDEASAFAHDLESLNERGDFTVAVVIRTAAGTKTR